MSYYSLRYLFVFLPISVLIYRIIPKKFRYIFLLLISLGFFMLSSRKKMFVIIFLILSILSIYISARLMSKVDKKRDLALEKAEKEEKKKLKEKYKRRKKVILVLTIIFNVAFLFAFKYLKFFTININALMDILHFNHKIPFFKLLAPIGISFYTLTALSYIIDVYNNKIEAEKNILKIALYVSFFPQIVEGPINSYSKDTQTLFEGNTVDFKGFCFGYQRIIYGLFKKIVIADRLNFAVGEIFKGYATMSGMTCAFGVVAYTIMLYMEFSGTMDIVLGSAELFGVKLPENFRQPFFSKNVSEFWTRWHISLGNWFKNYIFYPVSLSKKMKKLTISARKKLGNHFGPLISGAVALFAVWSLNGLWHGAGWPFLLFGMYHFVMILLGNIFEPYIIKLCDKLHINRKNIFYRIFQSVKMTIFIFIGELFFRAPTVEVGFKMLGKIFTNFTFKMSEFTRLNLDVYDYIVLFLSLIFIFVIGLLKEKNVNIREEISKKNIVLRWTLYYALIMAILIFGAYGTGYVPVDPIYSDF